MATNCLRTVAERYMTISPVARSHSFDAVVSLHWSHQSGRWVSFAMLPDAG
jgi:hypothetical protein